MKTITMEWLKEQKACKKGVRWFIERGITDTRKALLALVEDNHAEYANWVIVRMMTHQQKVKYALYATSQVLHIFENEYSEDKRPREAIDAVKQWVENPTAYASRAVYSTVCAVGNAIKDVAHTASDAASTAARAAFFTGCAVKNAGASPDANVTNAVAYVAYAFGDAKKSYITSIEYGLSLLGL